MTEAASESSPAQPGHQVQKVVYGYIRQEEPDEIEIALLRKAPCRDDRTRLRGHGNSSSSGRPRSDRGSRGLQNLVDALRPAGVVVPSSGHFSIYHDEVTAAVAALTRYGCAVLVVSRSTAAGVAS